MPRMMTKHGKIIVFGTDDNHFQIRQEMDAMECFQDDLDRFEHMRNVIAKNHSVKKSFTLSKKIN